MRRQWLQLKPKKGGGGGGGSPSAKKDDLSFLNELPPAPEPTPVFQVPALATVAPPPPPQAKAAEPKYNAFDFGSEVEYTDYLNLLSKGLSDDAAKAQVKSAADKAFDATQASKKAKGIHLPAGTVDKEGYIDTNEKHSDSAEVTKYLTKATDKQWKALTEAEKSAVKAYTGSAYSTWNSVLGKAQGADLAPILAKMHTANQLQAMLTATEKGALPANTYLYRRTNPQNIAGSIFAKMGGSSLEDYQKLVGKTYTDWAFQSTSVDKAFTESMHTPAFRIKAPKGLPGVMVGNSKDRTSTTGESEFIIKRGVTYNVTGVHKSGSQIVIDVSPVGW